MEPVSPIPDSLWSQHKIKMTFTSTICYVEKFQGFFFKTAYTSECCSTLKGMAINDVCANVNSDSIGPALGLHRPLWTENFQFNFPFIAYANDFWEKRIFSCFIFPLGNLSIPSMHDRDRDHIS